MRASEGWGHPRRWGRLLHCESPLWKRRRPRAPRRDPCASRLPFDSPWMWWGAGDRGERDVRRETGHWSRGPYGRWGDLRCLNSRNPCSEQNFFPVCRWTDRRGAGAAGPAAGVSALIGEACACPDPGRVLHSDDSGLRLPHGESAHRALEGRCGCHSIDHTGLREARHRWVLSHLLPARGRAYNRDRPSRDAPRAKRTFPTPHHELHAGAARAPSSLATQTLP